MKKRKIIIILVVITICASLSLAYVIATTDNQGMQFGQLFKNHLDNKEKADNTIVFQSDEITITDEQIKYYKSLSLINGTDVSDDDIKKKIITDALLVKEAEKVGVSLTDDEVKEDMVKTRESIKKDPEGYENYKSFIDNSGMTEEEYWEKSLPVYKKAYTIGKYRNFYLKDKFKESNPDLNEQQLKTSYSEYYNNYKEDLYNNYMKDKK